jgi:DNA-binding SARP family transcriptional activator/streptogramin lyase
MEFRILGPLEARAEGRTLELGGAKQRAVLSVLLLHANEVVPAERFVDELWGERPPASAAKLVQGYVSGLRRVLAEAGNGTTLVTRPPGYLLRLDDGSLDAHEFERLLREAREVTRSGSFEQAADALRNALSLWRGPALAGVPLEGLAAHEAERLNELRLTAIEERIAADLALGHHAELIPELESLTAEHPLREQLRGQLMLVLYRSGRQAEALETYQHLRRSLVEELGIEPSRSLRDLEQAILRHDSTLDLPRPVVDARKPRRRRKRLAAAAVAAFAVVAAVASGLLLRGDSAEATKPLVLTGNSVVMVDAATGTVVREVALGSRPTSIAVGEDAVWVANGDDETLVRLDPESGDIKRTIGLGVVPSEVAVGASGVWVVSEPNEVVVRVDPATNEVTERISLPQPATDWGPWAVVEDEAVWISRAGGITRIDPKTNGVTARMGIHGRVGEWTVPIASTGRTVWAALDTAILEIDPETNSVARTIRVEGVGVGPTASDIAATADTLWVAIYPGATLWKVSASLSRLTDVVRLGHRPHRIAVGGGSLWAFATDGTLIRVDPRGARVAETIPLRVYPPFRGESLAVGHGTVWVATTKP